MTISDIKRLGREPLVHFLLIGAALFVLFDMTQEQGGEAPNRIVVSSGQVEQLAAQFKRTWMRPPTQDELAALVENHVREEVFYREALAMGLDQNDPMVRQRMRMKLEFMLEELSAVAASDEVLTEFLQQHPDKFRAQPRVSFQQLYLNPDKREDLAFDAQTMLTSLKGGTVPESLGDATMLPLRYTLATQSEIARSFGDRFAEDVVKLTPGDWTGPHYSPFGAHLLKVAERVDARLPALAEIRALVEREYLAQRKKEQKDLAYQKLRQGYQVIVEPLATAQGSSGEALAAMQPDEAK